LQILKAEIYTVNIPEDQGRTEGGAMGHNAPGDESLGAQKSPNNIASTFFNTIYLLPGGAKLVVCPGRHPTSVRPC